MRVMLVVLVTSAIMAGPHARPAAADPDPRQLAGTWNLNTWLSDPNDQIVQEVRADFRTGDIDLFPNPLDDDTRARTSRQGSAASRLPPPKPQPLKPRLNADEQKRVTSLLDVVQLPSVTLTIAQGDGTITITDPVRGSRTFHITGAKEEQKFDSGTLESTTRWEGPALVTDFDLGHGNTLRFSYMLAPPTNLLLIRISLQLPGNAAAPFVIRHVYDAVTK